MSRTRHSSASRITEPPRSRRGFGRPRLPRRTVAALAALLALAGSAGAGDLDPAGPPAPTMKRLDVVEPRIPISSLPFTITQSGSYYVTGNLSAGAGDGIVIEASDVSIDLNGYTLSADSGLGNTGLSVAAGRTNISVRDGGVRGFNFGFYSAVASDVTVSDLIATENLYGVEVYGSGTIRDSIAANNGGDGFFLYGAGSIIRNSRADSNGDAGITATGSGSLVESCTASFNGAAGGAPASRAGIFVRQASRVVGCTTQDNAGSGIVFGDRNFIAENNIFRNGGSGLENYGQGENRLEANNLVSNTGWGILVGSAGNFIIRNSARGNQLGPFSIVGGNVAPIEVGTISNMASNVSF